MQIFNLRSVNVRREIKMRLYRTEKPDQRVFFWLILLLVLVLGCIPHGAQAIITCPSGYQCMAETDAAAQWGQGNYITYSSGVCGTDIDQTVYYYCFKQKPVTTTITTTPVTTIPQVSCPSGSQCMSDNKAISTWGQGNYEKYSSGVCNIGPVSSPYGGIDFCYGPKRVTTTPILVITKPVKTMITASGSVQVCAHIPCEPPKVLYCPDKCPGGCGVECVSPKELPTSPPPTASFVFSGIVDEWRFDSGQDMSREAPRYMQRVNNETILLYGSYYSTGYDVGDYIASGTSGWGGEYSITLGPNTPHRNYTYYFLSPTGAFNGRPYEYVNASSIYGHVLSGGYGANIYYQAPLNAGRGSGNNFMFFTRNTTTTGPGPATVINRPTLVYPGIIVTPPELVQQTPNFNIVVWVFSPIADFFRGLFGGSSPLPAPPATSPVNPQDINTSPRINPGDYLSCPDSTTRCQNECVDQLDDNNNCGKCGTVCSQGTICINGYCGSPDDLPAVFYCDDPTNPGSMSGDPRTDPYCCGGYGHKCRTDQICVNGQCRFPPAPRPLNPQDVNTRINTSVLPSSCNGQLVDLNTDRNNCGACNRTCEVRQSCINGTCAILPAVEVSSPAAGLSALFTHEPRCVPKKVACVGTECYRCPEGMICANGICLACNSSGQMICNSPGFPLFRIPGEEECVNTLSDPKNCGTCGKTCESGQICNNGQCTCPSEGQMFCGKADNGHWLGCIDVQSDPMNCGSCNYQCPVDQPCCCHGKCISVTDHRCNCPDESAVCNSGQIKCNGLCVDKQTNNQNCGSCGHICNHNCPCIDGACCPATFDVELKTWSCDC